MWHTVALLQTNVPDFIQPFNWPFKSEFCALFNLGSSSGVGVSSEDQTYRKTSNKSRVSNTSRGSKSVVLIEAGSPIEAGSSIEAGCHLMM